MLYHTHCRSTVFIAFPRTQSGNIARRETPSISACYVQTPVLANEKSPPPREVGFSFLTGEGGLLLRQRGRLMGIGRPVASDVFLNEPRDIFAIVALVWGIA